MKADSHLHFAILRLESGLIRRWSGVAWCGCGMAVVEDRSGGWLDSRAIYIGWSGRVFEVGFE